MNEIKRHIASGQFVEAHDALLACARQTTDYSEYISLCRLRKKVVRSIEDSAGATRLRIALIGGATTDFLEQPLALELETLNIHAEILCSDFNSFVPELINAESASSRFKPHVAIVLLTPHNIAQWPQVGESKDTVDALIDQVVGNWIGMCQQFHERTGCEVIISNMHLLPTRGVGSLGASLPWEANAYLRKMNVHLCDNAPAFLRILDVDTLASIHGVTNWHDRRFWFHAKQPVSFTCLVHYVRNLASIVGAMYGRMAKCLVLDLDNTLWGGEVGEVGIAGIAIGNGSAEGEAFKDFQEYLLQLKKRGLLLAVCSKNDEANALSPFEQLQDMVLEKSDFVSFMANWNPKPENIDRIAKELNVGLESLLFIDDNPAECELVRRILPQVKVLEVSGDPVDFPLLLDQSGWLETVKLTGEDLSKTDQYKQIAQRERLQVELADYESYLDSLEQKALVSCFDLVNLDRITQLINKTNQFNLTTKRLNGSEVQALLQDNTALTLCLRLTDRFGDNGLISVLSGYQQGAVLEIDVWLMSCRVLKRGVEYCLANHLFYKAQARGIKTIRGSFVPTGKNEMVRDFYNDIGFHLLGTEPDGTTRWELHLESCREMPTTITLVEENHEH